MRGRHVKLFALVLAALAVALVAPRAHADSTAPTPAQLFSEANTQFRDALATKDRAAAKALLTESIARYRALTDDYGIRNPELYVNIGNACLVSGDAGRAIAAFRRGERYDAANEGVRAGLDAARKQVGSTAPVAPTFSERALQWAGYLPRRTLLASFALAWIAGWTVLLARIMGANWPVRIGAGLLGLGAILAAPVVTAEVLDSRLMHAVIVAAHAPAYNGPSEAVYQPTFKDGLPAGIEVRLLEQRDQWRRVRLGDGRETWVRAIDLEKICPRRQERRSRTHRPSRGRRRSHP